MFTVRHEYPDGSVRLYTTCEIDYRKPDPSDAASRATLHMLVGPHESDRGVACGSINDGHVYVMNDKGATVAHFICGLPPAQQPK